MEISSGQPYLLTVNAGSSSIKLAVFAVDDTVCKVLEAAVENIGQGSVQLITPDGVQPANADNHAEAARLLAAWLSARIEVTSIAAVGHRIVHGGPEYYTSVTATDEVLAAVATLVPFDPEHLPMELELVSIFRDTFPEATPVLCFDTAFHHDLPVRSQMLPVPRHLAAKGLRRYGFHGLSYAYILEELRRVEGEAAANGRVIIAHLGSGASLAALHHGKPIDTTMSLTPTSGVPMSTRSGDLDPGVALYLAKTEGYDTERFSHMVNFESGLLGVSETTADMKRLLEIEAEDPRAKDAVDVFCYQIKKSIGSFTAALGGLDTLVFTGAIGERAPKIRARICEDLEFLGISLDAARNQEGARLISVDGSRVGVHVIHTDEAMTIARETAQLINTR